MRNSRRVARLVVPTRVTPGGMVVRNCPATSRTDDGFGEDKNSRSEYQDTNVIEGCSTRELVRSP